MIHWLPPLMDHAPLHAAAELEQHLSMPVTLDNRATVVARAEHWFGETDRADHFSLVAILERGMGAAAYRAGMLQTGYNGTNAEFAHVKIAFDGGRPCSCGGSGCLGSYATVPAIVFGLADRRRQSHPAWSDIDEALRHAAQDARRGDADALAVFDLAGRALGTSIASHVNENDAGRVIVTATHAELLEHISPALHATLGVQMLPALRSRTSIELRPLTASTLWRGAAAIVLEALFRAS